MNPGEGTWSRCDLRKQATPGAHAAWSAPTRWSSHACATYAPTPSWPTHAPTLSCPGPRPHPSHLHQASKALRGQGVEQLLDFLLALRVGEAIVFQARQHLVGSATQDVVRLVAELLRDERQQVLVGTARLLRARAVRVQVVVKAEDSLICAGAVTLRSLRRIAALLRPPLLARLRNVWAREVYAVTKLRATEVLLQRFRLSRGFICTWPMGVCRQHQVRVCAVLILAVALDLRRADVEGARRSHSIGQQAVAGQGGGGRGTARFKIRRARLIGHPFPRLGSAGAAAVAAAATTSTKVVATSPSRT